VRLLIRSRLANWPQWCSLLHVDAHCVGRPTAWAVLPLLTHSSLPVHCCPANSAGGSDGESGKAPGGPIHFLSPGCIEGVNRGRKDTQGAWKPAQRTPPCPLRAEGRSQQQHGHNPGPERAGRQGLRPPPSGQQPHHGALHPQHQHQQHCQQQQQAWPNRGSGGRATARGRRL